MSMIEITNLTRIYWDITAVDNVSLSINKGDIAVIVGTSGSGKTTLMRMINRLVEPSSGTVMIEGKDNRSVPVHELRRRIGYAIQGHGLLPHRTVGENIGTVPRIIGWDRKRIVERTDHLLRLFRLEPSQFRNRLPHQLSGGQQQRVGVARALAAEPPILLMDEPFGALDPIIRDKAQEDLLAIQSDAGTTIVLVTHDMEEAMRLGTRIAVMDDGKLQQYGKPAEIIATPATDFVRTLLGSDDSALRMLALRKVGELTEPGEAVGMPVKSTATLRSALSEALWSGREYMPVVDGEQIVGRISRDALLAAGRHPK